MMMNIFNVRKNKQQISNIYSIISMSVVVSSLDASTTSSSLLENSLIWSISMSTTWSLFCWFSIHSVTSLTRRLWARLGSTVIFLTENSSMLQPGQGIILLSKDLLIPLQTPLLADISCRQFAWISWWQQVVTTKEEVMTFSRQMRHSTLCFREFILLRLFVVLCSV